MSHPRNAPPQLKLPMATTTGQPTKRGECAAVERPCKWVSCRYNLHATHDRPGRRWHYGTGPPSKVKPHHADTCALDVAEQHPAGLDRAEVGRRIGVTREAVRLVEKRALGKLRELGVDVEAMLEAMGSGDDE